MKTKVITELAKHLEQMLADNYYEGCGYTRATLENDKGHIVDISYDRITGEVNIEVLGNATNCELPNIENAIRSAISTDRIDTEIDRAMERDHEEWQAINDTYEHLYTYMR